MEKPIRVLVANRPRLMRDTILTTFADQQHPEVRVIAVAPAKNYIVYYWASLNIHSSDIEASEQGVLNALRNKLVTSETN